MNFKIPLLAGATYGVYRGIKWILGAGDQTDENFRIRILRDAAEMIEHRTGDSAADIERSLVDGQPNKFTDAVARVECVLAKLSPSECDCKVVVALIDGDAVVAITTARVVTWDQLPRQVRHDFIRHGGQPQTYVLFERHAQGNGEAV